MKLQKPDLIDFIALTCGNVIFESGFFFKNRTCRQFTSGDGKLPVWIVEMSILVTLISSISLLSIYSVVLAPYLPITTLILALAPGQVYMLQYAICYQH
jgi:hypothetical protein